MFQVVKSRVWAGEKFGWHYVDRIEESDFGSDQQVKRDPVKQCNL